MQFWHKKAIFSGITKFQKFFRKIRTDAVTLKSSPHSEQLFCHSVFLWNLLLTVEEEKSKNYCKGRYRREVSTSLFLCPKITFRLFSFQPSDRHGESIFWIQM